MFIFTGARELIQTLQVWNKFYYISFVSNNHLWVLKREVKGKGIQPDVVIQCFLLLLHSESLSQSLSSWHLSVVGIPSTFSCAGFLVP